jgi:tetratricopeptide (TPR) repeat protein
MRRRPALIGIAAALVIALNIPTWETSLSYAGEADFYRGVASVDSRDVAAARAWFTAATVANPRDPRAWFELANISPPDDAIAALRHAAADDPWDTRASRRLAQLLVARDDLAGAIDVLEASIKAHARDDAHYAPDHLNLAFMLAQQHELERALAHFDAARRADPGYVEATAPRMLRVPGLDPAFVEAVR